MGELLKIEHLSYTYRSPEGETPMLNDVSFCVSDGEFLSLVGPGGCGKSTLLSLIAGLLTPTNGFIYINGTDIKASGKNIGYMLQKDQLLDRHSTLKDVSFGQETQQRLSGSSYVQINEGISTYGLITFINTYPSGHSECIRQRAALIRSLLLEPDILLLDEPFSALDDETRLEAADQIWGMLRKEKKTVILITDDIGEAISLSDRILVLSSYPGTLKKVFDIRLTRKELTPAEVRNTPEFMEYYNLIKKELDQNILCP